MQKQSLSFYYIRVKSLKEYIFESLELVYHYMSVKNLCSLLKTNKFYLSDNDGYNPKGKENYSFLSTTRQRNALTGYPTGLIDPNIVRITLDYNKLRSKYKSSPVDWGKAKRLALKSTWGEENFEKNKTSLMLQTNVENEERFFSKSEILDDFFNYVKQVDLCEEYCTKEQIKYIQNNLFDIPIKIYKTEKEFKSGR